MKVAVNRVTVPGIQISGSRATIIYVRDDVRRTMNPAMNGYIECSIPRSRTEHNEGKRLIKSHIHLRRPHFFSSSVASAPRRLVQTFERLEHMRASSIFGRSFPSRSSVYPVGFNRGGNGFREINQSSAPATRIHP